MPDKKIELPKLPYGEGSMVLMPDGETIQYRKVINGKRVAVYASSVKEALTKMKARKKEIEEIKKKQIRQEKRTETLKEAMTRWLYNYKIMN
jgi:ATP-dependent protease HslVU (ClpYQ) peptidase subunit